MEKELVSIIVPVYNAEKYLNRCIDSIINQSYSNFEIIAIDDGSADSSLDILHEYANKDNKIKVISKQNEGVSPTRNRGLQEAKGKYLCFVDSDDYVEREYLYDLVQSVNNNKSIGVCSFYNSYDGGENKPSGVYIQHAEILSRDEYLEEMSKSLYSVYYGALWNKIYMADIIKEKNIRFTEEVSFAEDFIFNLEYLKYIDRVNVIRKNNYYYWQGNDISLTKSKDVWYLWDMAKIRFKMCEKRYKEMGMYKICEKNIDTAITVEMIAPTYDIVKENYKGFKVAKRQLKELYSEDYIKKAIFNSKSKNMVHRIARLSISLRNYGLFVVLMRIWIKIQGKRCK